MQMHALWWHEWVGCKATWSTWLCVFSCAATGDQILKRPVRTADIERACHPYVCGSVWSARQIWQTSSRNLSSRKCMASRLCESCGGPLSGWTWCKSCCIRHSCMCGWWLSLSCSTFFYLAFSVELEVGWWLLLRAQGSRMLFGGPCCGDHRSLHPERDGDWRRLGNSGGGGAEVVVGEIVTSQHWHWQKSFVGFPLAWMRSLHRVECGGGWIWGCPRSSVLKHVMAVW